MFGACHTKRPYKDHQARNSFGGSQSPVLPDLGHELDAPKDCSHGAKDIGSWRNACLALHYGFLSTMLNSQRGYEHVEEKSTRKFWSKKKDFVRYLIGTSYCKVPKKFPPFTDHEYVKNVNAIIPSTTHGGSCTQSLFALSYLVNNLRENQSTAAHRTAHRKHWC